MTGRVRGHRHVRITVPIRFLRYERLTISDLERELYDYLYRRYGDTYIQFYDPDVNKVRGETDVKKMGNDDEHV